jgi:hypothetical protein
MIPELSQVNKLSKRGSSSQVLSQVEMLATGGKQLTSTVPSSVATVAPWGRQLTSTVPSGEASYREEAAPKH